jgi:hypothetical protein
MKRVVVGVSTLVFFSLSSCAQTDVVDERGDSDSVAVVVDAGPVVFGCPAPHPILCSVEYTCQCSDGTWLTYGQTSCLGLDCNDACCGHGGQYDP